MPADSTRTALIRPSIRLPSLNADAAAATPSGAADSALASVAYATCINGLDLVEASGISGDGVHPINAGHEQFADNFALAVGL